MQKLKCPKCKRILGGKATTKKMVIHIITIIVMIVRLVLKNQK